MGEGSSVRGRKCAAQLLRWPVAGVLAAPGRRGTSADGYQTRQFSLDLERAIMSGGTAVLTQVLSGLGGGGWDLVVAVWWCVGWCGRDQDWRMLS
jgi:hypothetical protein